MTPLFHLKKLRSYFGLMNDEAQRLVSDLATIGGRGSVALAPVPVLARSTMRVICRAAFGTRLDLELMIKQCERARAADRDRERSARV